jgi:Flp pilus assembly protein TadG
LIRLIKSTKPAAAARPAAGERWWRRLAFARSGATAVEFALIGLPFVFMIFTIIELALIMVLSISLEDAASNMARKIRVGTYVAPGNSVTTSSGIQLDLSDFKTDLCSYIYLVPSSMCTAQVQVDVRPFTSFSTLTLPSPLSAGTFNSGTLCYYSGAEGSIVLMRVYYLWPLIGAFWLGGLNNVSSYTNSSGATSTGQWSAISATEVFVNEANPNISNTTNSC